jgi:hypothetical protein
VALSRDLVGVHHRLFFALLLVLLDLLWAFPLVTMKQILLTLLLPCAALHSCVTLSGELVVPGTGQPGSLGGKITGTVSWPPAGKEPVGKEPVGYIDTNYINAIFGQKATDPKTPPP